MLKDCLGQSVALGDRSSLAGVDAFVDGFLACEARVVEVLRAAEHDDAPGRTLGHDFRSRANRTLSGTAGQRQAGGAAQYLDEISAIQCHVVFSLI